jgi:hypothetical protein
LYRTTLVGDVPLGSDGARSVAIEGSPVSAARRSGADEYDAFCLQHAGDRLALSY